MYCTVSQIESEFKNITFTVDSSVTISDVERFIEEASAYIDGVLDSVYVTPITGVVSLLIVQQVCIWLVSQRIKDIQALKTSKEPTNQITSELRLDKKAENMLKSIVKDEISLPDAIKDSSTGGVSSYNSRNNITPIFKRDTEQW